MAQPLVLIDVTELQQRRAADRAPKKIAVRPKMHIFWVCVAHLKLERRLGVGEV